MRTLLLPLLVAVARAACPDVVSCSPQAKGADPCCIPQAGLFLFQQKFDPEQGDSGTWGISGVEVMECDGSPATTGSDKLTHEDIGQLCANTLDDEAERAWAQSEVGEGVEEVWERSWNTAGRFIFPSCPHATTVPLYFSSLQALHASKPTASLLDDAGISPSGDIEYSLADISAALDGGIPLCEEGKLQSVIWPLHSKGQLAGWEVAKSTHKSNCPKEGIIYPPGPTLPTTTSNTFDRIYRPTMRPITMSADENRRVKYDEPDKKLGFFKGKDAKRGQGHKDEL